MAVKCLGVGAKKVCYEKHAQQETVRVAYGDDRFAAMTFAPGLPFVVTASMGGGTAYMPIQSDFFKNLIADILRFYQTGELPFDTAETLEVMKIREAALRARDQGTCVEL